jgi:nucleoporin NUP159
MSSQPSFGSTVSVDTSTGGSTLGGKSVFGTPAHAGGIFNKPSLTPAETQESDMMDDGGEKVATPKEDKPAGLFGLPVGEFKLGSTFTPGNKDDKSDTEEEKPKDEARPRPLFGADFGAALGDAQKEREKTASPQIKKEPEEDKPSIFGIPAVTKEEGKPKPSLFGSATTTTPAKSTLSFGKPSPTPSTLRLDPEPPQVTSKPAPSPSTTTAPSNDSKDSSKESKDGSEASGPLAGDEAEAIEMPESDDDDLAKEPEEEVEDAPLPPDPSTIKVSKDFYLQNLPGEKTAPKAPSPLRPQKQLTTGPLLFGEKISTTPSGFPKAPQMFAPPVPASREMPRSPSPVRSASTPAGKLFSKPPSRPTSTRPQFTPPVLPQQKAPAEPIATPASLQDKEAEQNRAILESSIQPTLDLAPYITHQDYVGPHSKAEGTVSAQIETLFCDINAMVDTLGLNARALNEFVEGHNSLMPDRGRSREDLENTDGDEGWCLVEVDELMQIERGLGDEIESVRVGDREAKVAEVYGMRRELVRVKNSLREVRRFIEAAKDEERAEQRRRAPLDGNSEARQRAVRRDMAKFLKALAEAEDAVSLLKVRLANVLGKQGRSGPVPTVEAVEKTVRKMTQWAEEKGADMDVLEARMKKLGLVGPSQSGLRSSQSGLRRSGLFSTPSPRKSPKKMSTFAVPEESESEGEEGFVDVDPRQEAVRELVETRKKKSVVMGRIKDAIRRRGLKVTEG